MPGKLFRRNAKKQPCIVPSLSQEDDGRVIAPMNVEGMPWYRTEAPTPAVNAEAFSKRNLLRYSFYAVGAGLLIALAFGGFWAALIWFSTNVWLG